MSRFYDSSAWRRFARRLLLDERPLCRICEAQGRIVLAQHVDHIVPLSEGGDALDAANLQPLCAPCHSRKTAADQGKRVRWGCDASGAPIDPKGDSAWTSAGVSR
jgi:5-methylcytosine-specific restriction endonuclease McrA